MPLHLLEMDHHHHHSLPQSSLWLQLMIGVVQHSIQGKKEEKRHHTRCWCRMQLILSKCKSSSHCGKNNGITSYVIQLKSIKHDVSQEKLPLMSDGTESCWTISWRHKPERGRFTHIMIKYLSKYPFGHSLNLNSNRKWLNQRLRESLTCNIEAKDNADEDEGRNRDKERVRRWKRDKTKV